MLWLCEFDDYERMNPLPLIKYFMTHFSIQNGVDNHFLGEGRIRAEWITEKIAHQWLNCRIEYPKKYFNTSKHPPGRMLRFSKKRFRYFSQRLKFQNIYYEEKNFEYEEFGR